MPALASAVGVRQTSARRWLRLAPFLLLLCVVACEGRQGASPSTPAQATEQESLAATSAVGPVSTPGHSTATPPVAGVDLSLKQENVKIAPLPLRAGSPFTVTVVIDNDSGAPAMDVPLKLYIAPEQELIGYSPFVEVVTATLPTTRSVSVKIPVRWNLGGGMHRLWVRVNRLPKAWQSRTPVQPEADLSDNSALLDVMVEPFDAFVSSVCPGRVDVEVDPADVFATPDRQQVQVRIHNIGNKAVYNLPVLITGDELSGIAYTPPIPPCGGTAEVSVTLTRSTRPGELLAVQVNPEEWETALPEDDFVNNKIMAEVSASAQVTSPPVTRLPEYDFSISTADIQTPESFVVLITVHNLGTRDAAKVPIRVENQAGRKISDAIPIVQGNGEGVAAIRVGYLWTRGGVLTFTVNPSGAKGAFPESNLSNNVATFALP